LLAGLSTSATNKSPSPDELFEIFTTLALGSEAHLNPDTDAHRYILKWVEPLRVRIYAADNDSISGIKESQKYFDVFGLILEDLKIEYSAVDDFDSNFTYFYYSNKKSFLKLATTFEETKNGETRRTLVDAMREVAERDEFDDGLGCLVLVNHPSDRASVGQITNAIIVLPTFGKNSVAWNCFLQESLQALGVLNGYLQGEAPEPTLFEDNSILIEPSSMDLEILQILYNPRVRPGMTRGELRQIWPELVSEVRY